MCIKSYVPLCKYILDECKCENESLLFLRKHCYINIIIFFYYKIGSSDFDVSPLDSSLTYETRFTKIRFAVFGTLVSPLLSVLALLTWILASGFVLIFFFFPIGRLSHALFLATWGNNNWKKSGTRIDISLKSAGKNWFLQNIFFFFWQKKWKWRVLLLICDLFVVVHTLFFF